MTQTRTLAVDAGGELPPRWIGGVRWSLLDHFFAEPFNSSFLAGLECDSKLTE
jgi:hypothetical protein